jgi:hypothetical protein
LSPFRAFNSTVSIFLEHNKVKHFLTSFTDLLLCRIQDCLEIRIPLSLQLGRGWKRILGLSLLALFSQGFSFILLILPYYFLNVSILQGYVSCPFHHTHLFIGYLSNKKLLSPFQLSSHHPLGRFHSISTTWDMSYGLLY